MYIIVEACIFLMIVPNFSSWGYTRGILFNPGEPIEKHKSDIVILNANHCSLIYSDCIQLYRSRIVRENIAVWETETYFETVNIEFYCLERKIHPNQSLTNL